MNFKKTWKRFFTVSRASEGFTLVELIVVIAILAILAGIAVPAYSGYIKKANKAADLQLLGAVNTAFAAAVLENGHDVRDVDRATIVRETGAATRARTSTAETGWRVAGATAVVDGAAIADFSEAFLRYYGDNENAVFKAIPYENLRFVNGAFVDVTTNPEGVTSYTYAGSTIYLTQNEVEALVNSTFLTAESLGGSAGLLNQVDQVTLMAQGMAGSLQHVWGSDAFAQTAMNALGVTTEAEYTQKQDEIIAAIMEQNPGMARADAVNQLAANATVLYAAQSAVNFTDAQISTLFSDTGSTAIKNNLKTGNTTEGMAQAALVYGMYTAYANSAQYGNADLQANTNNASAVLNALDNDDNFKTYVNSAQGQADLNAYLSALDVINNSAASDPAAVEHLMVNGFNNNQLKDLLAQATGK